MTCRNRWRIALSSAFAIGLASPAEPSRAESAVESPSETLRADPAESTHASRDREIELQPHLWLAMRVRNDFTDRVEHETLVGAGVGGVGDAPDVGWQVTSGFSYAVLANVRMSAGYRALGAGSENLERTMHGPMPGSSRHF